MINLITKNMQKGTAVLFLLIAVLVILVICALYFSNLIKPPVLPVSFRTLTPPSGKTSLQTSNPKSPIFSSQNLGLEFQYPIQGFTVNQDSEEEFNQRGNGDFRKNFKGYVGYEPGKILGAVSLLDKTNSFETNPLTVWVFDNPDNLTEDEWFNQYWYYPFLWGVFDNTSKGHITPDIEVIISTKLAKGKIVSYQPGEPKYVYLSENKRMYLFRVIGSDGETILSSVQLLEEFGNDQDCKVTGCSGQLCVEESQKDIVTTCEFRQEYVCFKDAKCERQKNGQCGWTQTEQLTKCLQKY